MTTLTIMKYLIVAEIEETGFIIKQTDSFIEAEAVMENVISVASAKHAFPDTPQFNNDLKHCKSYPIHHTNPYTGLYKTSTSNGTLSVSIYDTKVKGFSIKKFIYERAAIVNAFDLNEWVSKKCGALEQLDRGLEALAN